MLFIALEQLTQSPAEGLVTVLGFAIALLVGFSFHEFSHAAVAMGLGDNTALRQGRVTLNPRAHLDPMGTLMILVGGFGWAKPVPVNPGNMRVGIRTGMALTSIAGPIANIIVALIVAIGLRLTVGSADAAGFYLFSGAAGSPWAYLAGAVIFWNLLLAAFNILPIAPLDGFKVALGLLPPSLAGSFARTERYGPYILLGLILLDFLLPGPGILSAIIRPIVNALASFVVGGNVV